MLRYNRGSVRGRRKRAQALLQAGMRGGNLFWFLIGQLLMNIKVEYSSWYCSCRGNHACPCIIYDDNGTENNVHDPSEQLFCH